MQPSRRPSEQPSGQPSSTPSTQPSQRPALPTLPSAADVAAMAAITIFFSSPSNIIIISLAGFGFFLLVIISAVFIYRRVEKNAMLRRTAWENTRVANSVEQMNSPWKKGSRHGDNTPDWNYPSPNSSPGSNISNSPSSNFHYGNTPILSPIRKSPPSSLPGMTRNNLTSHSPDFYDLESESPIHQYRNQYRNNNGSRRRVSISSSDSGDNQHDTELYDVYQRQTQLELEANMIAKGLCLNL
jgi:hypothetical protein